MPIRLVDDWKKVVTYGSAQLALAGAAVAAASPALDAWNAVPDTVKHMLPSTLELAMPMVIFFVAIFTVRHFTTTPATPAATTAPIADAAVDQQPQ